MAAAGTSGRVTVDELGRRMERLEKDITDLGSGIHRRLDELNYVHPETLDTKLMLEAAHRNELERRVAELEAGRKESTDRADANRRLAYTALASGLLLPIVLVILLRSMGLQ